MRPPENAGGLGQRWTAAAGTDLGLRRVHGLLLEAHGLGQHGAVVLATDVLVGVVQPARARPGRRPGARTAASAQAAARAPLPRPPALVRAEAEAILGLRHHRATRATKDGPPQPDAHACWREAGRALGVCPVTAPHSRLRPSLHAPGASGRPPGLVLPCGDSVRLADEGPGLEPASGSWGVWRVGLRPPGPYLAPFFFEKVPLTWRWRLLSSKAAKPPLSSVTDSSTLATPLPKSERGREPGPGERARAGGEGLGRRRGPGRPR